MILALTIMFVVSVVFVIIFAGLNYLFKVSKDDTGSSLAEYLGLQTDQESNKWEKLVLQASRWVDVGLCFSMVLVIISSILLFKKLGG